jgi:Fe-S oxidoreductase
MEPSCLAVFKDEITKILPHDDDARRLYRHAYHFAEFFEKFDIEPPTLEGKALMWGHCHHNATGGMSAEQSLLEKMGLEVDQPEGGCCGLAGSWGFESGKYDISMDCGEQALLPAVRDAKKTTYVVADGFSCKTQIKDAGTGRRALHVAQLMKIAREDADKGTARRIEKKASAALPKPPLHKRAARLAVVSAAGAATVGLAAAVATRTTEHAT